MRSSDTPLKIIFTIDVVLMWEHFVVFRMGIPDSNPHHTPDAGHKHCVQTGAGQAPVHHSPPVL